MLLGAGAAALCCSKTGEEVAVLHLLLLPGHDAVLLLLFLKHAAGVQHRS
jgi:hypothetical protein